MGGMEMMLKSLGFDPAQFQEFLKGMQETLIKFNTDLETIKAKQILLEKRLDFIRQDQSAILTAVSNPPVQEYIHG